MAKIGGGGSSLGIGLMSNPDSSWLMGGRGARIAVIFGASLLSTCISSCAFSSPISSSSDCGLDVTASTGGDVDSWSIASSRSCTCSATVGDVSMFGVEWLGEGLRPNSGLGFVTG